MTEENTPNNRNDGNDLRTVIPRLEDLLRKCRSVGSRSDEAVEMEARIETILKRLGPAEGSDSETVDDEIPYTALARELYAVERFFESNGFLSIAKEVAHVERTLESFAPADQSGIAVVTTSDAEVPSPAEPGNPPDDHEGEMDPAPSKWAVPKPLAVIGFLFLVAMVVCVAIIVRHLGAAPDPVVSTAPQPTPQQRVASPLPTSTPRAMNPSSTPAPGAILAEAVGQARLALADGDIDGAIDHLSKAALVDADHATVIGTANKIVELLVERANAAVDRGLWEVAGLTLARAERIATRFGLDNHQIDQARHRHSQMTHFTLVQPGDSAAIRAAAGKRVTIFFKTGSQRESIIKDVHGGQLLLDHDTTVRGGAVYYTEKVPLGEIDYLKVWEE